MLHVAEKAQQVARMDMLTMALDTYAGIKPSDFQRIANPPLGAGLGYRRRATLHRSGSGFAYFERGSHRTAIVDHCPVLCPPLEGMPLELAKLLQANLNAIQLLHLLAARDRVAIGLKLSTLATPALRKAAGELVQRGLVAGVVLIPQRGPSEDIGDPTLDDGGALVRPDAFAQASEAGSAALVEAAREFLGLQGHERVLELFVGNGNFALRLLDRAATWLGVDSDPVALRLARVAAGASTKLRLIQGDAIKVLNGVARGGEHIDAILLDPPRNGAPGIGDAARRLGVRKVVYISCEPRSLARDAKDLVANGFRPEALCFVDQFPQTHHVEAVLSFAKETNAVRPEVLPM